MKEIARIVRRGKLNARVEFTDGVQALIPNELAEIGQGLDEARLVFKAKDGKKILMRVGDNSYLYQHQKADKETGLLSNEIWVQFDKTVTACMSKFVGFRWVKPRHRHEVEHNFSVDAILSGVPVRMAERSQELRGGYIYSCVKGWLMGRYRERCKERSMFVSFEACEDFLPVDGGSLLTVLESWFLTGFVYMVWYGQSRFPQIYAF